VGLLGGQHREDDLLCPSFGPDDFPRVTYGNIGALVGWLMATFPDRPSAWEVQLTESGVNSLAPCSSAAAQAEGVCRSLHNVLGTPFIENYVYHRMIDPPVEVAAGLGVGLWNADGTPKPAWATWALANRIDLDPPQLSCGFEYVPYTRLVLGRHPTRGRRASTRHLPAGFTAQAEWRLHRRAEPGTHLLFECLAGDDGFVSPTASCEGQRPLGPLGWAHTAAAPGTVALWRCYDHAAGDHWISEHPGCGGAVAESRLGWVLPATAR
jgi:hypothetical protein